MNSLKVVSVTCLLLSLSTGAYAGGAEAYDGHGRRDPFVPLLGITTMAIGSLDDVLNIEDVDVQGIASNSEGARVAILNGEMVKEGQTAGRVTVKRISKDGIIIIIDGAEYALSIYGEEAR